jgi:predicted RNase H-like HicB family nuclease
VGQLVKLKAIVHHDPDGLWAEVPAIPGCASQGETMADLIVNLREAIEGCLCVDIGETPSSARIIEIAV